eukprot:TRINITY_DN3448_c0_g1_i1.p1 TRINITY_DN3448_c0_g1~~TRINITY_DN3448_c0_g1_i1.p1  ORF type:complete len:784 (-),score=65.40 TRINITY_DN3448_c0_g1_i1:968-3319(-)
MKVVALQPETAAERFQSSGIDEGPKKDKRRASSRSGRPKAASRPKPAALATKRLACNSCRQTFASRGALVYHQISAHQLKEREKKRKKPFAELAAASDLEELSTAKKPRQQPPPQAELEDSMTEVPDISELEDCVTEVPDISEAAPPERQSPPSSVVLPVSSVLAQQQGVEEELRAPSDLLDGAADQPGEESDIELPGSKLRPLSGPRGRPRGRANRGAPLGRGLGMLRGRGVTPTAPDSRAPLSVLAVSSVLAQQQGVEEELPTTSDSLDVAADQSPEESDAEMPRRQLRPSSGPPGLPGPRGRPRGRPRRGALLGHGLGTLHGRGATSGSADQSGEESDTEMPRRKLRSLSVPQCVLPGARGRPRGRPARGAPPGRGLALHRSGVTLTAPDLAAPHGRGRGQHRRGTPLRGRASRQNGDRPTAADARLRSAKPVDGSSKQGEQQVEPANNGSTQRSEDPSERSQAEDQVQQDLDPCSRCGRTFPSVKARNAHQRWCPAKIREQSSNQPTTTASVKRRGRPSSSSLTAVPSSSDPPPTNASLQRLRSQSPSSSLQPLVPSETGDPAPTNAGAKRTRSQSQSSSMQLVPSKKHRGPIGPETDETDGVCNQGPDATTRPITAPLDPDLARFADAWSEEETDRLVDGMRVHGQALQLVADVVGSRTAGECKKRARALQGDHCHWIGPGSKSADGEWTEYDACLIDDVPYRIGSCAKFESPSDYERGYFAGVITRLMEDGDGERFAEANWFWQPEEVVLENFSNQHLDENVSVFLSDILDRNPLSR